MMIPPTIAALTPDGRLTAAQRRRVLIDISRRRIKPGSGSSYKFLERRTAMQSWPDLQPILAGLAWAIVGGVATRTYMPERATKYLDILVEQHDGSEVIRRLEAAGYRLVTELAIPGFLLLSPEGVEVDLLLGNFPWLTEALARPTRDPAGYPVLDLPYLILMKLETSRAQDVGDISRILSR
jgi:hypothetical protein